MTTTERRLDPYKADIIGLLLYKSCYNILKPHTLTYRFSNKDIREIPIHIKTSINNIKGCGPLNSIHFNGFSLLSGNISSTNINLNGPFNNTKLSMFLFADRFGMISFEYKTLTSYMKAMVEGYIPQIDINRLKTNYTKRDKLIIRSDNDSRDCDYNIKGRIEGEWVMNDNNKYINCIKYDINDNMFNIATAFNIYKYNNNKPIIMVTGVEVNIDNEQQQKPHSCCSCIDGIFGIGARFAPCSHFQISLRSDWSLTSMAFRRLLFAACSEDNIKGRSLALMISASSLCSGGGGYEILIGGKQNVFKMPKLESKYGIYFDYEYRIDLLKKEVGLSLYNKYNITNNGKYILNSKISINYEHDRLINRRSINNNIPIGIAFKFELHVQ